MSKMENMVSVSTATTMNKNDYERREVMDYTTIITDALAYLWEKDFPLTINEFEELLGVHCTTKHTGKMEGMASLSTACIVNPICIARSKVEGSICQKCFAERMFRQYGESFENCFVKNYEVMTGVEIPIELMPLLNYLIFRIESFGDVANETQAKNYWNLAKQNEYVTFGWWTKNYDIVAAIFDKYGKPSNVKLIVSSPNLNEQLRLEDYPYADKIFTVYTKEYLKEHPEIVINCGGNKCLACQRCYRDGADDDYINEIKK